MESYQNLTITQSLDSEKNRQKVLNNLNLGPGLGMTEVKNYLDYGSGILTQHIGKINFCKQMNMGEKVIIKDKISQIRDPSSGVTKYLGL